MTQRRKHGKLLHLKAGSGTIEATFDSLSPVAFVVDGDAAKTVTTSTSPKTGETATAAYAGLIAVVAALGMGVTYYKKRKAA